ncbi:MAG: N-acetylneuraminate synthase family protein [Nitrospirota bacterium]
MEPATIVAEIGCNHKGSMEIAKELIKIAAQYCRADVVKFQKRNPRECLTPEEYHTPHPEPYHSYGKTYGEHREALEFSIDQHRELKECCAIWGIAYSSSVWDMTSAREIAGLDPPFIKIPSACNTHFDMLSLLCDSFRNQIHISLGMTTQKEQESIVEFLEKKKRAQDVVLYACTSSYPVSFEDTALLEIKRLKDSFGGIVQSIGFSGHHLGIAIDIAAYTLGAEWIERHFTLDRTWKGTDHAASLEPDGLRRLTRDMKAAHKALTYKKQEILEIEIVQRAKLKWNRANDALLLASR